MAQYEVKAGKINTIRANQADALELLTKLVNQGYRKVTVEKVTEQVTDTALPVPFPSW